MEYNGFSFDIEADGFVQQAQNLWVLCLEDLDSGEKLKLKPFQNPAAAKEKFIKWLDRYDNPHVAFHNGLGYDIFVLLFLLGIEHTVGPDTLNGKPVRFVDTFYLSMFLYPDRKRHSLEEWGNTLGDNKIDFRQRLIEVGFIEPTAPNGYEFQRYHPIMDEYCTKDTSICSLVMKELIKEWIEMYGSWDGTWSKAYACGQKSFYLMSCQELTGWKFDIPKAEALKIRIGEMMEELRAEVEPQLPPRPLKKAEEKEYTMPAKPFKMNGEYSANWEKFAAKHNAECVDADNKIWKFYGKEYKVIAQQMLDVQKPMEMANQDQMKDWFLRGSVKKEFLHLYEDIEWVDD